MSILITGDTHGTFDMGKIVKYFNNTDKSYTKDDYLIICGDVGVCGISKKDEVETRQILGGLPVTVLFIDGNHENFDELNSYAVEKWHGGKVHIIGDLIHLMRGQVFEIDGKKFFTFGGAYSIDRMYRSEGTSWWPEELPSKEEYEEGMAHLEENGYKVDYIITHTAPRELVAEMGMELMEGGEELGQYLQRVADWTEFSAWYFGHFHEDTEIDDTYFCLYNEIVEIMV